MWEQFEGGDIIVVRSLDLLTPREKAFFFLQERRESLYPEGRYSFLFLLIV